MSDYKIDNEENIRTVSLEIRKQIDLYCAKSALVLKQNIEALIPDDSEDNEEDSEFDHSGSGADYNDIQEPLPPLRKREWK